MISHDLCRDQLGEFLDQTLDSHEREQVESHLESCADCAQIARELATIRATLREMPSLSAPPDLRRNVRVALRKEAAARAKTPFLPARLPAWAWSGTVALAAVILMVLTRPFDQPPLPPPAPDAAPKVAAPIAPAPTTDSPRDKAARPGKKAPRSLPSQSPAAPIRRQNGAQKPIERARATAPAKTLPDRPPTIARAAPSSSSRPQERLTAQKQPISPPAPSEKATRAAPPAPTIPRPTISRRDSAVAAKPEAAPSSNAPRLSADAMAPRQESPISQSRATAPLFALQLKTAPNPVEEPRVAAKERREFSPPSAASALQNDTLNAEAPPAPNRDAAPPLNALNGSSAGRGARVAAPKTTEKSALGAAASENEKVGKVQRFLLRLQATRAVSGARVRLEIPASLRLLWPASNLAWSGDFSPEKAIEIPFSLGAVRGGEEISVVVEQNLPGAPSKILETQTLILPVTP